MFDCSRKVLIGLSEILIMMNEMAIYLCGGALIFDKADLSM